MHLLSIFVILVMLAGAVSLIVSMFADYGDRVLSALGGEIQPASTAQIYTLKLRRSGDFREAEPLLLAA